MNMAEHQHDEYTWEITDARGIYLTTVCCQCQKEKMALIRQTFRGEVLADSRYEADEAIDPEDEIPLAPR